MINKSIEFRFNSIKSGNQHFSRKGASDLIGFDRLALIRCAIASMHGFTCN
jgi:hypothetical protein